MHDATHNCCAVVPDASSTTILHNSASLSHQSEPESVGDSLGASVGASVGALVGESLGGSCWCTQSCPVSSVTCRQLACATNSGLLYIAVSTIRLEHVATTVDGVCTGVTAGIS